MMKIFNILKKKIFNPVRGAIIAVLLAINMFFCVLIILLVNSLCYLLPSPTLRIKTRERLQFIPIWWMDVNFWIMQLSSYGKWHTEKNATQLNPKGWYLLISNHQSWIDIFVLGIFFRHKIPNLKFFMKKELLWSLPFASWACYVLDYPFMARYGHKELRKRPELKMQDIETTRRACEKFKEFPTTVMNFVEGTRFTAYKHDSQQSPYQYLLKPKVTGVGLVLNEMHDHLSGILNVTIHYKPSSVSFWHFVLGDFEDIYLDYELLPIVPEIIGDPYTDRDFRKRLQQWLNSLWQAKDHHLKNLSG